MQHHQYAQQRNGDELLEAVKALMQRSLTPTQPPIHEAPPLAPPPQIFYAPRPAEPSSQSSRCGALLVGLAVGIYMIIVTDLVVKILAK